MPQRELEEGESGGSVSLKIGEMSFERELVPYDFSSGSRGFFVQGKLAVGERRYQVQVQAVEIGSKNQK